MKITNQKIGKIEILFLNGNLINDEFEEVKNFAERYIEDNNVEGIIFNCERVGYIDSSGLGFIAYVLRTLTKTNKKFALSSVSKENMKLFTLTKLDKILCIAENDQDSLEMMNDPDY